MTTYLIQTSAVFSIEAKTEAEARQKFNDNLMRQDCDEMYGNELVYIPYEPGSPTFCEIVDIEDDEGEDDD